MHAGSGSHATSRSGALVLWCARFCVSTWYVNESSKSAQRRWERPNTGEESAWRSSMELFSLFPFSNLNNDPTRRLLYFQLSYYDGFFLPRCYKEVIVWGFLEDGVWVIGTSSSASCPPLVLRANFLQEKPKPQRRLKFTPCARFRVFLPAFASEPAGVPTYEPPNTGGWRPAETWPTRLQREAGPHESV